MVPPATAAGFEMEGPFIRIRAKERTPSTGWLLPAHYPNSGRGSLGLRALGKKMYTDFYGFSDDPFALNPDPRFFFLTPNHRQVLSAMVRGISHRRGGILLTGEKGTGKTTFVQRLLQSLDPNITAISIYDPPESFDHLLEVILQRLRLPLGERSQKAMQREFTDYLSQGAGRHAQLAIIVDNAQELSKGFLEDLGRLRSPNHGRLQEVFVGRPEIEDKLASWDLRKLKQRIAIRCRLKPLTEEESLRYIEHRLGKVGGRVSETFIPEALSLICRYSGGVPETINTFCTQALWAGYSFSKKPVDSFLVREILEVSGILPPEKVTGEPFVEKIRAHLPIPRLKRTSFAEKLINVRRYLYGEVYGLAKNPFHDRPDPGFYFVTENCREIWNSILYGLGRKKGFILLTGESGVGKTTFLGLVSLYLSTRGRKKVIPLFHSPDSMEEILQTVLRNLGLPGKEESQSPMLSRINEELIRRSSQGESVAVLFDEAQNLKKEILEEILLWADFNPKMSGILQFVFVGDPEFEKKLADRDLLALEQRFEVRSRLLPFTLEESRDYIEYRLQRAGSNAAQVFTPRAMNLIIYHSSGIPRTLNQVCYEALWAGYTQFKEKVDLESVGGALVNLGLEKEETNPS